MPLSQRQKQYLHLMGIPVYQERIDNHAEGAEIPETQTEAAFLPDVSEQQAAAELVSDNNPGQEPSKVNVTTDSESEISIHQVLKRSELPDNWSDLIDHVASCTRCSLHETRTQTVFGVGDINADWMIIGEAPGAEEDKLGEPFVGRAGQLLTTILESIGLGREKVYIANTLKCRPPGNRDPKKSEAAQCRSYLEQQIALVDPKIIICVGRIASQNVLQAEDPISRMRGKVHSIQHPVKVEKNIPVIVTYHPAYLLRSPSQKRKVWEDLKLAFSILDS